MTRRRSLKRMLGLTAGVGVLAIGAGPAEAAPLRASFDDAAVRVFGQDLDVLEPPNLATFQGADVTAGAVTIPSPSGLSVPGASGTLMGFNVTFSFAPTGAVPITGTLGAGGELSLQSHSYRAVVSAAGSPSCTYDANLAFGTAAPSGGPFNGDPFTTGAPDTTLTQGVLETHWNSLPPDPQAGCGAANTLVASPGGLALAHGFNLPGTPLGAAASPPGPNIDPPEPTGARAAALKKCAKIKSKKKKRKCKRRARELPV